LGASADARRDAAEGVYLGRRHCLGAAAGKLVDPVRGVRGPDVRLRPLELSGKKATVAPYTPGEDRCAARSSEETAFADAVAQLALLVSLPLAPLAVAERRLRVSQTSAQHFVPRKALLPVEEPGAPERESWGP